MENQNQRKEELRLKVEAVLKRGKSDQEDLSGTALDEILQEVSIYHQELEYQNDELQRLHHELEKVKNQNVELFQNAPIGYVVVNLDNQITMVNTSFADMVGLAQNEVFGTAITNYIHPDFQDQFYLLVKRVSKDKSKSSALLRLNSETKTFVKLECNIHKENGNVFYRMGFLDVTREVVNEQQLIDSRERYRAVADYAYHWEYWQDPGGRLLYMSPSCERITGYTKYEFFENPDLLEQIIHPDDKHLFDEHKSVAIIPGETRVEHTTEYRITRKDGKVRWIGHACQSIFKEDGTHIGQRATNRDITERKRTREELKQNVTLLSQTQRIAHIGSWELDVENNKLFWSDEIYRIFGSDSQQFDGSYKLFLEIVHPDDREAVNAAYVNSLRNDENAFEIEHRIVRRDNNEVRCVYEKCYHERDNNGRVIRSVGIVQDITERKQREQKLVVSDRIFNHTIDMLCIAGFDGYFNTLNPAWSKTLGWSTEELLAKPWIDFVHKDDREATKDMRAVLVDGEEIFQFENRFVCKDGSYKWLSWNSYPYPKENVMFGVVRDVTYKKQAEERLRNSELQLNEQNEELTSLNEELYQSNEELRNVMDELHDSNQRTSALLAANPDTMFVYSRNGVFLDFHSPNPDVLLLKPKDFLNRKASEVLPDFLAELNQRAIDALFETGKPQTYYYSLEINKKTSHFDARMVRYGEHKALSIVRDITQQKLAEEKLAHSHYLMRYIIEHSRSAIAVHDREMNYIYVSQRYLDEYKVSGKDIIGKNHYEIFPDLPEKWKEVHAKALKGIVSNAEDDPYHKDDGTTEWTRWECRPWYDMDGSIGGVIVYTEVITERKQTELALRESEERFRGLYENATVGIYRTTPDGQILLANPTLIKMLEYSSFEELTMCNLNNQDHETGYQRTEFMRQVEESGEVKGLQSAWRTKSGKVINISESARTVYDNKGKVLYYEGIVEDVTERTKAVDALRASQERISSILRVAPIGIGVVVNRVLIEVNQTTCDIIGYSKEELIGKSAQILYPSKKEFEYVGNEKYRQIAERGTGTVETIWQRKDGSLINVLLSSTPISQNDLSQGVTFTALDITQRKQTERLMKGRLKLLEFADTYSLAELLKEALAVAEDLTGSQIGFYHFIDEENGEIKLNQWSQRTEEQFCKVKGTVNMHYPIDMAGVWVECITKRKPIIHNDYQALPNKKGLPHGHTPLTRELVVPVIRNRRIVAVLGIGNKATDYSKNDIDIITQLADMAWDIAERKMAEEALRASEAQYRLLFENMTQGFALSEVILDNDGAPENYRIVRVNPAYERLTGFNAKNIVGKTIKEVLPNIEPYWIETFGQVALTGKPTRYENYTSGLDKYFDTWVFSPQKGQFAVLSSDITQRKKAEEQVLKLTKGIEQSPAIVLITDIDGNIEFVNPRFTQVTGYSFYEVVGQNPRVLNSGHHSSAFYQNLWDTILNGNDWKGEMLNRKKNGETYWESALISPVKNEVGEIKHFIAIKEDITERKKAEEALIQSEVSLKEKNEEYLALNEELTESNEQIIKINQDLVQARLKAEESDRLKSAFLANMSHEIRTPMNAIIGFSEMLLTPSLPTERKDFFAQILNTACHQLLSVVEDVIDISKIETGQMEIHRSEMSINKAIYRIRDIFEPQAQANGVEINALCFFPDNRDDVLTDAGKLNQVLTNLLNNALKFTESGTVDIGYTLADSMLKFYVKDTGVGIDPSNHELIFERFRQVEMGSTRNYGGTGLGLPISKAFIEMLGGAIWVESELGKGAKFYFTIPYEPVFKPQVSDGKKVEPDSFCFADKIILVAEDEEANYLYISELIEETRATLIRASDGQAAVDIVQSNPDIDLVLMDIKMPVMTGVEAARIIRGMDIKVPIIALTAYAMTGDRENCLAAGCNAYISKPVRRIELLKAIAEHLANR